jgi:hypothetical protein
VDGADDNMKGYFDGNDVKSALSDACIEVNIALSYRSICA